MVSWVTRSGVMGDTHSETSLREGQKPSRGEGSEATGIDNPPPWRRGLSNRSRRRKENSAATIRSSRGEGSENSQHGKAVMLHTTRTCDRCGCTIDGQGTLLTASGELRATVERIDLCQPCGLNLVGWLRGSEGKGDGGKAS